MYNYTKKECCGIINYQDLMLLDRNATIKSTSNVNLSESIVAFEKPLSHFSSSVFHRNSS